jgi:DNA-binding beta-propeller fold protein YncE
VVTLALLVLGSALFTLRTAAYATYGHGDVPREFLFYTQTAPDVPDVVRAIDQLAVSTGQGRGLRVQVDRAFAWPWAWYLRRYNTSFEVIDAAFRPDPGAVLILGGPEDVFTDPYRRQYQPPQRFTLRWWFPESYRVLGTEGNLAEGLWGFVRRLSRGSSWQRWGEYLVQRDVDPQGIDGVMYVPLEYSAGLTVAPPEGEQPVVEGSPSPDLEGRLIIGRIGSETGQLMGPVGVAVKSGGAIWVADSGNARVQAFDAHGQPAGVWGSLGSEPGQFNQPAGLAAAPDGSVFVADTWNHRIQRFGPDMSFAGSFGKATADLLNPGPDEMWGPRGVAVDGDGNVWVTDTGTHRVRKFAPDGSPIASFGSRGRGPRQFVEPVGIAVGPDGSVFVADAGNARIQKFAPDLSFVAEFPIPQWADRDPRNKPYLAALPDGRLLATDGPHGRVLLIGQDGAVQGQVERVGEVPLFFPAGVAYDAERGYVYVTDSAAGFVARFPLTDFALR